MHVVLVSTETVFLIAFGALLWSVFMSMFVAIWIWVHARNNRHSRVRFDDTAPPRKNVHPHRQVMMGACAEANDPPPVHVRRNVPHDPWEPHCN